MGDNNSRVKQAKTNSNCTEIGQRTTFLAEFNKMATAKAGGPTFSNNSNNNKI